jgi:hypothetical protein
VRNVGSSHPFVFVAIARKQITVVEHDMPTFDSLTMVDMLDKLLWLFVVDGCEKLMAV